MNKSEIKHLCQEFTAGQKTLIALGDEMRQQLLILMVQMQDSGVRVVDIAEKTSLSRPAVSHHLQILKDAGIIKSRKDGRFVYYYFDPSGSRISDLMFLLEHVKTIITQKVVDSYAL